MGPLCKEFYTRDSLIVAKELLNKVLIRYTSTKKLVGKIVDVEAYKGFDDPASYAYKGKTLRSFPMFSDAGSAFITIIHGSYCFNVTTEIRDKPGAILVRALQPLSGLEMMMKNRGTTDLLRLTSGPIMLTKAFGITKEHDGLNLTQIGELFIGGSPDRDSFNLIAVKRIRVRVGREKLWRFYIEGNEFISKNN